MKNNIIVNDDGQLVVKCSVCGDEQIRGLYWQLPDTDEIMCSTCHARWLWKRKCKVPACGNQSRYDSGFCGIHDVQYNAGAGAKREGGSNADR